MRQTVIAIVLLVTLSGCGGASSPPATPPEEAISADGILADVRALSGDDKEGRAPGTAGEERTIEYLTQRFTQAGLQPGNPDGTYVQRVPLIAFTGQPSGWFNVKGRRTTLTCPDDWVAIARQGLPDVSVDQSAVVFVGYGVEAPEYRWDDFKGLDVRGKTLIMLVGDPPVPDPEDPSRLDASVRPHRTRQAGSSSAALPAPWRQLPRSPARLRPADAGPLHDPGLPQGHR